MDLIQRNFAGGELSPSIYARSDQVKYQTGLRTCLNFIVRKSGGVCNRPGTRYVTASNPPTVGQDPVYRLLKFIFNDEQTYIIEISPQRMRIIKNGALMTVGSPAAWSNAVTYTKGLSVSYGGVNYVSISNSNLNKAPSSYIGTFWHPLVSNIFEYPYVWESVGPFGDTITPIRYQQSGDILILAVGGWMGPFQIVRSAETVWYVEGYPISPSSVAPVLTGVTSGGAGANSYSYVVTSIKDGTFEESLQSNTVTINAAAAPTSGAPHIVNFTGTGVEYDVYRAVNGKFGFIGTAVTSPFNDIGYTPDTTITPPRTTYAVTPNVLAFVQQRLVMANFGNVNSSTTAAPLEPEAIRMSRTGKYNNFTVSLPSQDDDAVSFNLASKRVAEVRAIFEIGTPVVFTADGEWVLLGGSDGVITPTTINAKQQSNNGASERCDPVQVDDTVIYVQARGSVVRDFKYSMEGDGYSGRDLSVYADHLFKDHNIVRLDYAQNPHSIVWALRDDGVLLGLSYLREHSIWGWHRHVTDGEIKDIAVIPEGQEDVLYMVVKRTISGGDVYYIERLEPREDVIIEDAFYVDCGLSYDGRNTNASHTMRINSQPSMTVDDVVTVQSNTGYFVSGDVGNAVVFYQYDTDGTTVLESVTVTFTNYVSTTQMQGVPNKNITTGTNWMVDAYGANWAKAVDEFTNLGHLEGKSVSILSDGNVISDGIEDPLYTVASAIVTIPRPGVRVHIGLPYTADFETMDLESQDNKSLRAKPKLLTHVAALVQNTSSLKAGTSFDNLRPYKIRENEAMSQPTQLKTGFIDVSVDSGWDEETRVVLRQSDPLPCTITAVIPRPMIGG